MIPSPAAGKMMPLQHFFVADSLTRLYTDLADSVFNCFHRHIFHWLIETDQLAPQKTGPGLPGLLCQGPDHVANYVELSLASLTFQPSEKQPVWTPSSSPNRSMMRH